MATYPTDIHPGTLAPVTTATPAATPKRGFLDFGLTDAERDAQLQRTVAINNQEMARLQAKRAAEQAAVNQPIQGPPIPPRMPAPMMGPSYPYQIPNRDFTWQTTPQEQMALAGRMNRQDLQHLLGSGEYGPLAGQQYRYTPQGTTQINYGPGGGYGSGFGWPLGGFPPGGYGVPDQGYRPPPQTGVSPLPGGGVTIIDGPGAGAPDDPGGRQPGEPAGWTPPLDFTPDAALTAAGIGPFHQWTRQQHQKYYPDDATKLAQQESAANLQNAFAFEDYSWEEIEGS